MTYSIQSNEAKFKIKAHLNNSSSISNRLQKTVMLIFQTPDYTFPRLNNYFDVSFEILEKKEIYIYIYITAVIMTCIVHSYVPKTEITIISNL